LSRHGDDESNDTDRGGNDDVPVTFTGFVRVAGNEESTAENERKSQFLVLESGKSVCFDLHGGEGERRCAEKKGELLLIA
jgi:hypothetical protein